MMSFVITKCYWGDAIEEDEMGGSCGTNKGEECACRASVRTSEGKTPLARPRHRWGEVKMDTNKTEQFGVGWINLARNCRTHVNKIMNRRIIYINKIQKDATLCRYLFTAKSLYMFRVSIAPIIRST